MLNIAVKAARQAGKVIMRHLDRLDTLKVQVKGRNDFVSEVDFIAETEIINAISAAYPEHAILAEESGTQSGNRSMTAQPLRTAKYSVDSLSTMRGTL